MRTDEDSHCGVTTETTTKSRSQVHIRAVQQRVPVRVALLSNSTAAAGRPRGAKSATGVLGLVLTIWRLASTDAGRNEALGLHELERRRLQAGTLSGFVEYLCLATAVLFSPVHHGIMDPRALLKILEPFEVDLPPVEDGAPERLSVRGLLDDNTSPRRSDSVSKVSIMCGHGSTCVQEETARPRGTTKGTLKRFRESSLQQRIQKDGATCARM